MSYQLKTIWWIKGPFNLVNSGEITPCKIYTHSISWYVRNKCYSQQESAYNFNYLKWKLLWEFQWKSTKWKLFWENILTENITVWNNPLKAMGDAWKKMPWAITSQGHLQGMFSTFPFLKVNKLYSRGTPKETPLTNSLNYCSSK